MFNIFGERFNFNEEKEGKKAKKDEDLSRILTDYVNNESKCGLHQVFHKEKLSCRAWNNLGKYIFQLLGIMIITWITRFLVKVLTRKNKIHNINT
jgi:hypothetical protein